MLIGQHLLAAEGEAGSRGSQSPDLGAEGLSLWPLTSPPLLPVIVLDFGKGQKHKCPRTK